jgi:hypothetical protein
VKNHKGDGDHDQDDKGGRRGDRDDNGRNYSQTW